VAAGVAGAPDLVAGLGDVGVGQQLEGQRGAERPAARVAPAVGADEQVAGHGLGQVGRRRLGQGVGPAEQPECHRHDVVGLGERVGAPHHPPVPGEPVAGRADVERDPARVGAGGRHHALEPDARALERGDDRLDARRLLQLRRPRQRPVDQQEPPVVARGAERHEAFFPAHDSATQRVHQGPSSQPAAR